MSDAVKKSPGRIALEQARANLDDSISALLLLESVVDGTVNDMNSTAEYVASAHSLLGSGDAVPKIRCVSDVMQARFFGVLAIMKARRTSKNGQ